MQSRLGFGCVVRKGRGERGVWVWVAEGAQGVGAVSSSVLFANHTAHG